MRVSWFADVGGMCRDTRTLTCSCPETRTASSFWSRVGSSWTVNREKNWRPYLKRQYADKEEFVVDRVRKSRAAYIVRSSPYFVRHVRAFVRSKICLAHVAIRESGYHTLHRGQVQRRLHVHTTPVNPCYVSFHEQNNDCYLREKVE